MDDVFDMLAVSMAFENNLDHETAEQLVRWLDSEGVLDYDILKEVYLDPTS